jgi:hypothetical protein
MNATYKIRALDLLDHLEGGHLRRIEECRREIEAREVYLRDHPEWLDRPDARSPGRHTWEDSLQLAERNLERVRRAREIARGLSDNHPSLYVSSTFAAGSPENLIAQLLERGDARAPETAPQS